MVPRNSFFARGNGWGLHRTHRAPSVSGRGTVLACPLQEGTPSLVTKTTHPGWETPPSHLGDFEFADVLQRARVAEQSAAEEVTPLQGHRSRFRVELHYLHVATRKSTQEEGRGRERRYGIEGEGEVSHDTKDEQEQISRLKKLYIEKAKATGRKEEKARKSKQEEEQA